MPLLLCLLLFERRALEFLAAAEELQPGSLPTGMLRLSVQLAAKSEAGAVEAVAALAASAAAEPDALRLACCECVDAGVHGAARQALLSLLERCAAGASSAEGGASTAGLQAAGYEATVFQNLIKLVLVRGWLHGCTTLAANSPHRTSWSRALSHQLALLRQLRNWLANCLQDPPDDPSIGTTATAGPQAAAASIPGSRTSELARLFDLLVERMRAAAPAGGPADFFAGQDGRSTQLEWFALQVGAGRAGPHLGAAVGWGMPALKAADTAATLSPLVPLLPLPTPLSRPGMPVRRQARLRSCSRRQCCWGCAASCTLHCRRLGWPRCTSRRWVPCQFCCCPRCRY